VPNTNWTGSTSFGWNAKNATLYATNNASVNININTPPTISSIPDQNICVNNQAIVNFTVGDAETAVTALTTVGHSSNHPVLQNSGLAITGTGANRTLTITPVTNKSGYAIATIVVDDGFSTSQTSFNVVVGPNLEITGATNVCPGDALNITANETNATSYNWSKGGTTLSTTRNLTINPFALSDTGDYVLTIVKGGCTGIAHYRVIQHHKTSFTGSPDGCLGDNLMLAADEVAATYQWKKGGSLISSNQTLTLSSLSSSDAASNYTLTVSRDGCTITSDPFTITVNQGASVAAITGTTTICEGTSTNLQVSITGGTSPFEVFIDNSVEQ